MSALTFSPHRGVSFGSDAPAVAGFLNTLGGQPGLVLKTVETGAGWASYFSAMAGNMEAASLSSKLGNAVNLGEKSTALSGALGATGKVISDIGKMAKSVELIQSGKDGGGKRFVMAGVSAIGQTSTAIAKAGEFTQFLSKTNVVEIGGSTLGATIQGAKIITDAMGIVQSGVDIADTVTRHDRLEARKAKGEMIPNSEQQIHDMKSHESWLGMLKNVSAIVLHILSFLSVILGIAFANPILLAIGTVVLVSSIALFFIGDNRKAEENKDVLLQINRALDLNVA